MGHRHKKRGRHDGDDARKDSRKKHRTKENDENVRNPNDVVPPRNEDPFFFDVGGRGANAAPEPEALDTGDLEMKVDVETSAQETAWPEAEAPPENEYFGMLSDDEHAMFKDVDDMLASNFRDAPPEVLGTAEQQTAYLRNAWESALPVALKLACSQSHSRFLERLVVRAAADDAAQLKRLFEAFAGHFLTLVQHRFASHCCEMLFLHAAPAVTAEMGTWQEKKEGEEGAGEGGEASMEELFLLTLDELEGHLGYLMTDTFASHSLRLLLLVLSGRPLDSAAARAVVRGSRKESVAENLAQKAFREASLQPRVVPLSFGAAVRKIIQDTTASLGTSGLLALMESPTGNPILQLLLELDMSTNAQRKKRKGAEPTTEAAPPAEESLLDKILPGAPDSLADAASPAAQWVSMATYSPTGSRIVEVILAHCPSKTFKALQAHFFRPRMATYLRNDVAAFCVARALARYGREDLAAAIEELLPLLPLLLEKGRFSVVRTVFERAQAVGATEQVAGPLTEGLVAVCGEEGGLLARLCYLEAPAEKDTKVPAQYRANKAAMASHGAQLLSTMLTILGAPCEAVQEALAAAGPELLYSLATQSRQSVGVLTAALAVDSRTPGFHKGLAMALLPRLPELALHPQGYRFVAALAYLPSKGQARSLPPHLKERIVTALAAEAKTLKEDADGRKAWGAWRGDKWLFRPGEWRSWAKSVGVEADGGASAGGDGAGNKGSQDRKTGAKSAGRPGGRKGDGRTLGRSGPQDIRVQ